MPDLTPKQFDVKKVPKQNSQSVNKFWQESTKQLPKIPDKKPSSLTPWLYGFLFVSAFSLSIITTTIISNRQSPNHSQAVEDPTVTYEPQSKAGEKNPFDQPLPQASTATETQPDSTPSTTVSEPEINKQAIRLRILNGNGIAGDAAKMKQQLEQAGFSVASTGNAKFSYTKTQVYYISGKKKEADLVAAAITNRETIVTEAATSVVGDNNDILVVVGKQ